MALTPDFINRVIHSDASITDAVAFHQALRDIESSDEGVLYPVIHTYKEISLDGGSVFPAIAFINGWTLEFAEGVYEVRGGNYKATINPVPNCYVKVTQAAAYAVSSALGGSGGMTLEDIALAVQAGLTAQGYTPARATGIEEAAINAKLAAALSA